MKTRIKQSILLAVLGVTLSLTLSAPASAEQCQQAAPIGLSQSQEPVTICLLTDTSRSVVLPATLEFKVPAEATRFNGTLAGPGPAGTNIWRSELDPVEAFSDGTLMFHARASIPWSGPCDPATGEGCGSNDYDATFAIPVKSSIANLQTRVVRRGKRYIGIINYEGRTIVASKITFLLGLNHDVVGYYPKQRGKRVVRPAGPQVIRIAFSRRDVKRRCMPYRYCKLLVEVTQSHPYVDEQGQEREMPITPDHANGLAGLVVQDRRKACKKLRKKNKRVYRERCRKEPPKRCKDKQGKRTGYCQYVPPRSRAGGAG